jgi:thiamine pyrophosphokinase
VSSANTWTFISVTVPGDTSGTWLTNNSNGIKLTFSLGTGSTYSGTANAWAGAEYYSATGAVSVVGTNGATWYITGVQLEVGSQATSFDFRDYGREFIMCQRYYETSYPIGYSAGYNFGEGYSFSTSQPVAVNLIASDDTLTSQSVRFVVQKRTNPTVVIYSANNGASGNTFTYKATGGTALNVSAGVTYTSANLWNINQSLGAVSQANESYFHFTADAEL